MTTVGSTSRAESQRNPYSQRSLVLLVGGPTNAPPISWRPRQRQPISYPTRNNMNVKVEHRLSSGGPLRRNNVGALVLAGPLSRNLEGSCRQSRVVRGISDMASRDN